MVSSSVFVLVALALNAVPSWGITHVSRSSSAKPVTIPLDTYFNNKAFGSYPGEASLDTLNQSFPALAIATNGKYISSQTGIEYDFPGYRGPSRLDNVVCLGQDISVIPAKYLSVSMLVTLDVESASISENLTFHYSDSTATVSELRSQSWVSFLTIDRGEIIFPYRYTANSTNHNTSNIFEYTGALTPGKVLTSITLPSTANATTGRLHVFSVSLWKGSDVQVQSVRPTQKWSSQGTQIVEVTVNNAGAECVSGDGLQVSITGENVSTIDVGALKRLCPGDQKRVHVGVIGKSNGGIAVVLNDGNHERTTIFENIKIGLESFTSDLDSLAKHESPDWFDDAKFGIFIHWGPYAVSGWGNSTPYESYSEWFWWYSTHHPQADRSGFYDYRLRTFGPNWNYDDSFREYTADAWDPKEWVDLFADAGAKYFVFTSKHHDGFANFDTGRTSNRSSINYGPKRDILRELFDAAKKYQPDLKRGTYFSLPEWFNPDFGRYGYAMTPDLRIPDATVASWPGIIARNPYTGLEEPYTGRVPINDFIADLMVPQMEILAYNYSTDIIWCDCGAANGTAPFAAAWWNRAKTENRQVTLNSRCGLAHAADFDTPEYTTFRTAQRRKWESSRGMDPYSYGYNRATPDSAYMNATTIITSLIDIVSKNGNFLLDIGPQANGTIVKAMSDNLRAAGKWIRAHEEAIFKTSYWFVQSEIAAPKRIRFTQTEEAFYIFFLDKPEIGGSVVVDAPVPILPGDSVTLLGADEATVLTWEKLERGGLKIDVPASLLDEVEHCWVFKITYLA